MKNMINGRGYIGLSASNISGGLPVGAAFAALFFGFCDALATTLKSSGNFVTEFLEMIPYLATIFALVLISILRNRRNLIRR